MKVGIEVRIDVTKIERERLYVGEKGKYLTMTTFVDLDQVDQYDNNGFIAHKKNQDEQGNTPILGNVKVFWKGEGQQQQAPQNQYANQPNQAPRNHAQQQAANYAKNNPQPADDFDQDIPF